MADFSELLDKVTEKVLAAIDASEAGDAESALALMEQASMALSVIPNGTLEDADVEWDRESIDRTIANLRRRVGRKGGVVMQAVRYERG